MSALSNYELLAAPERWEPEGPEDDFRNEGIFDLYEDGWEGEDGE
jgi:hypothetical protein